MKITLDDFNEFAILYDRGFFPSQRFGQAFMNRFGLLFQDSELFYEEKRVECIRLIWNKYLDLEKE